MFGRQKDLRSKIAAHMGRDPGSAAIISEEFEGYNHPNLHIALEEFVKADGRSATLLGIQGGALNFSGTSMRDLVSAKSVMTMVGFGGAKEGPVQFTNIQVEKGKSLACIEGGLYLVRGKEPLAILLRRDSGFAGKAGLTLDVLALERTAAEDTVNAIRAAINKHNIYRGKILSVTLTAGGPDGFGRQGGLTFHHVPPVTREQIILPDGLLKRIERQTIEAGIHSEVLRRAGRKIKRGILLHGRPGTGKTLTAMYLASAMENRTVLVVTGRGQGTIQHSAKLARWLAPSMVLIEDVDLIAEERSQQNGCNLPILFELLNEMDGLEDDCDVLFVLTTNRPEVLEPALASRPGRVDQAYEIPLPDAAGRKQLFELYKKGLDMQISDMDSVIQKTKGASGAFIAELMRKAALFAAPEGEPIVIKDKHLDEAMHELLLAGGSLTKNLLGFSEYGFAAKEKQLAGVERD